MLELIFLKMGSAFRRLIPICAVLLNDENHSNLRLITNQREDLEALRADVRICFVLSPSSSQVRRSFAFLEKFINPTTTILQVLGRDILLIGRVGDVRDLLKLYEFIASNRGEKDYRLLPVYKVRADEMAQIVASIFDQIEHLIWRRGASGAGPHLPVIQLTAMASK